MGDLAGLEMGFELDRRYRWMQRAGGVGSLAGERMDASKKPDLLLLCELLERTPYALIGGLALQIYQAEPRTTLDIDVAVLAYESLPSAALLAAGFVREGHQAHSENWRGPGGTPIQFSDDPAFAEAIRSSETHALEGLELRVVSLRALLRAKLRAGQDPARRKSKRMQDLADVQALLEQFPALDAELSDAERVLLA
jgi:hypothetical protein